MEQSAPWGNWLGVPAAKSIQIPDYPDEQGPAADIENFRQDIARQLGTTPDRIVLTREGDKWTASVVDKADKSGTLSFADRKDNLRLSEIAHSSRSPVLVDFGKIPTSRTIRIQALSEASAEIQTTATKQTADRSAEQLLRGKIERFREAILCELGVQSHEVQVLRDEGGLVAVLPATGERIDLLFDKPQEQREFVALAERSKAPELVYFGLSPGRRSVTLPRMDLQASDAELVNEFRARLSQQLGMEAEHIQILEQDGQLVAFVRHSDSLNLTLRELNLLAGDDRIDIFFTHGPDLPRLRTIAGRSKSPVLTNYGTPPSSRRVSIPAYNPNDGRDKNIQRFKEDVARAMATAAANIEIRYEGGVLEAYLSGNKQPVDIVFASYDDFTFFVKTAIQSKSPRLEYFGQKRSETRAEFAANTGFPDPRGKANFSQTISNETFIGDAGLNKVRTSVSTVEPLTSPFFQRDNLKNFTLGFHNLNWGGGDISFDGKSFKLIGLESTFLTTQFTTRKDSFLTNVRSGDPQTIVTGLGVLAGLGVAAYAFSEWWPEPEKLNVPLLTKLYADGTWEINAGTDHDLILGGKQRDLRWKGTRLEVKENIASGVSASQAAAYDPRTQLLSTNLGVTWQRLNLGASHVYDMRNQHPVNTHLGTSYGFDLAPKWVMSMGYQQDFDAQGRTANPTVSDGVTYTPTNNWLFNLNSNVATPRFGEPLSVGLSFKTGILF